MTAPLVQLYCKKLTLQNMEAFLAAGAEHIGWQLNFGKLAGDERRRAVAESGLIAERLRVEGVTSVFLVHPTTNADDILAALKVIQPDIFLASSSRDADTLRSLADAGVDLMVPVGIPQGAAPPGYDPQETAAALKGLAKWMTTDTITAEDSLDAFGCSGQTSDWALMSEVIKTAPVPVIAAGGLRPDNVGALWDICQPAGMDAHTSVCTGGQPDRDKAIAFAKAVRALS